MLGGGGSDINAVGRGEIKGGKWVERREEEEEEAERGCGGKWIGCVKVGCGGLWCWWGGGNKMNTRVFR